MRNLMQRVALATLFTGVAALASAEAWKEYHSKEYGFSMLVPAETEIAEQEWGDWGGIHAKSGETVLYGVAKLGEQATAEEIEKVGVKVTGIEAGKWKEIDADKATHGLKWHKTVKAMDGKHLVYGIYGAGEKGSYLLVLYTTPEEFAGSKADFDKWYASLEIK